MANWQTDKEYAKYVKERGGRRSGKGYERFLERKVREKEAEEERQKKEKEREEDKIWISTTKAGKECAEQNNDISDEEQRWKNIRKARLNYEEHKNEVIKWSKDDNLGKKALAECTETDEELKFEFLENAYNAAKKAEEDEKKRLQAEKDRERQKQLEIKRQQQKEIREQQRKKEAEIEYKSRKRKSALLCFFLGILGVHNFYNKKYIAGIVQLVLFFVLPRIISPHVEQVTAISNTSLPAKLLLANFALIFIWWLVDFITILTGFYFKNKKSGKI